MEKTCKDIKIAQRKAEGEVTNEQKEKDGKSLQNGNTIPKT